MAEVFHPNITTGCDSILLPVDSVDILRVRVRQSKDVSGKVTGQAELCDKVQDLDTQGIAHIDLGFTRFLWPSIEVLAIY